MSAVGVKEASTETEAKGGRKREEEGEGDHWVLFAAGHAKHQYCPCSFKITSSWDFPGGPVGKTLHSQCRGFRFDASSGN